MNNIQTFATLTMELGECPRWNVREQAWYWVDITGKTLYRALADGQNLQSQVFSFKPACFGFTQTNAIVLTSSDGVYLLEAFGSNPIQISNVETHLPEHRFNDGLTTPNGNFIAGSLSDGDTANGTSYLFEFTQNQTLEHKVIHKDYKIINGQAFSPDGHWYYVTDTPTSRILKYPFNADDNSFGQSQVFYQFEQGVEHPDGAAIDAEGNYWIALWGSSKICVISPEGVRLKEIDLPASQPSMVAFGGPLMNQLLITTARQDLTEQQCAQQPLAGSVLITTVDNTGIALPNIIVER